jgi:hypothetical protein
MIAFRRELTACLRKRIALRRELIGFRRELIAFRRESCLTVAPFGGAGMSAAP